MREIYEYEVLNIKYTNYRGATTMRCITPIEIYMGSNEFHTRHQWLMKVWDHDKDGERDYALSDCDFSTKNLKELKND